MTTFNIHNSHIEQLNNSGSNLKVDTSGKETIVPKIKVLFLAANPKDTNQLRLDEEIREIQQRVRAAEFRDRFEIVSRWAVRTTDLLEILNEVRPDVVHFSGHGSTSAKLVLEDKDGNAKLVEAKALAALFRSVKDNIRLVVFNFCHSEEQAKAVSDEIDCVIGMNDAIGDEAAITFGSQLYGAIAFGRTVGEAYEQGRTALMLDGIPEEDTPVLLSRPGVDAKGVSLVAHKPVSPLLPPIAYDILLGAVSSNTPITRSGTDAVSIQNGEQIFDSAFDMEKAALLVHAIDLLQRVGWIRHQGDGLYHVTHEGYQAARQYAGTDPTFAKIKKDMPGLIGEMKKDLGGEGGKLVREFFVLSRRRVFGGCNKPHFTYYEEDHENLSGMIDILENHGYIQDVTMGKNVPHYRMTEKFVELVLSS